MRTRVAVVLAVLTALVAGCSKDIDDLPPPPSTSSTTATTVTPDFSGTGLGAVPGRTTTTVALGPGRATLAGTVIGPDGPVAGARVLVQRLVADGVAEAPLVSDAAGHWSLPGVLGGRYRLRSWLPPELAQIAPTMLFVEATEEREIVLRVERQLGIVVSSDIAPNPPVVDEAAGLVVLVTNRAVGEDGVVRAEPVTGVTVELFGSSAWEVLSINPTYTSGSGEARWMLRCGTEGRQPLSVSVGSGESQPLEAPTCVAGSGGASTTSTTEGPGTTSTTRRGGSTSTTSPRRTSTTSPG